jgi:ribosomal protein S18 acetylase RimI-like enzyme
VLHPVTIRLLLLRIEPFVAWKGGPVIGGAMILCHRGVAGLYDVRVDKALRRQGIGATIMREACRDARDRGMHCAVLGAGSQGKALYERVGFSDAGRYGSYFLSRAGVAKRA